MKLRRRAARQHVHDQAVIDHLTHELARSNKNRAGSRRAHRFDSEHGRDLLDAIRKRWVGKGGLPDY